MAQEAQSVLRALGIDRPYALVVATLEPRKNLGRLSRHSPSGASRCRRPPLNAPAPVVGVGPSGWGA
jgi:hypothetical protein